ncbi:MAG TPA: hypothetical protein VNB94_04080 [Mycobacteriales bacterium]|nr:hypothetical protein [Mycobacteriales bacterium]
MASNDPDLVRPPDAVGPPQRAWYRRNAFLTVIGGVLVVIGNFFLGLIAVVLLAGDRTRDADSRVGGAVLIFAWMFIWTLPGASPYAGFALLGIAAWFLLRSARRRATGAVRAGWRTPAALGVAATALAVLGLVPYGVRSADFDADTAVTKALAARANGDDREVRPADFAVYGGLAFQEDFDPIRPAQRLVAPARFRFTNAPIYYVVLLQQNPTTASTGDGEPCFSASETLTVHGITGQVVNLGRQDARAEDGTCLPLLRGTRDDLAPVG